MPHLIHFLVLVLALPTLMVHGSHISGVSMFPARLAVSNGGILRKLASQVGSPLEVTDCIRIAHKEKYDIWEYSVMPYGHKSIYTCRGARSLESKVAVELVGGQILGYCHPQDLFCRGSREFGIRFAQDSLKKHQFGDPIGNRNISIKECATEVLKLNWLEAEFDGEDVPAARAYIWSYDTKKGARCEPMHWMDQPSRTLRTYTLIGFMSTSDTRVSCENVDSRALGFLGACADFSFKHPLAPTQKQMNHKWASPLSAIKEEEELKELAHLALQMPTSPTVVDPTSPKSPV